MFGDHAQEQRRDCLAKGWTLDEENDQLIPPGWVKQGEP